MASSLEADDESVTLKTQDTSGLRKSLGSGEERDTVAANITDKVETFYVWPYFGVIHLMQQPLQFLHLSHVRVQCVCTYVGQAVLQILMIDIFKTTSFRCTQSRQI
jgi:hypothetical protein